MACCLGKILVFLDLNEPRTRFQNSKNQKKKPRIFLFVRRKSKEALKLGSLRTTQGRGCSLCWMVAAGVNKLVG